jgi:hypothetical protein
MAVEGPVVLAADTMTVDGIIVVAVVEEDGQV